MNPGGMGFHAFMRDDTVLKHHVKPHTLQRILGLARPYTGVLAVFLLLVVLDAATGVVNPLIFRGLVNHGVLAHNSSVVIKLALAAAGVGLLDAALTFAQRQLAARIGFDLVLDLRTQAFAHIQKMSLAFFTRARTGALVSRLQTDVGGVRDAFSDILSTAVGNVVTTVLVLIAMFALSWQLTLSALIVLPLFLLLARFIGKRLRKLTKEAYERTAELNTLMVERFNVAGATLAKIFGRPEEEAASFTQRARRLRDVGLRTSLLARVLFITLGLISSLAVTVVYGWGGVLAAQGKLDLGTLIALSAYLFRLYGPLTALSNLQVDVMTTLVSFERVFEVMDLEPAVAEKPGASPVPPGPVRLEFDRVEFRYPSPAEVSIGSFEANSTVERPTKGDVLHDLSFTIEPGTMTALVGPSGGGKTTTAMLVARLYDPRAGAVRFNGLDLRDATLASVRSTVGMVMQDAHLFHDTLRANLLYANPGASEDEMRAALAHAQIWKLVESLPSGLDTMLGDRGYRLSGGERQRIAIARLLLKAPPVVVLDEATAHLDSESEHAIQTAFKTALTGRTSLVIAHRLSTILNAQQILVLEQGRIVERGRHEELLQSGQLYAHLYQTQFARKA